MEKYLFGVFINDNLKGPGSQKRWYGFWDVDDWNYATHRIFDEYGEPPFGTMTRSF
jgi:hypothetical protein